MSHTAKVDTIKISDIAALQAAVNELSANGVNCELVPNAAPRAYYSNQQGMGTADYVLKLHDSRYDVGFYKSEDGTYEARSDFWGGDVAKQIGVTPPVTGSNQEKMGRLYNLYSIHAASRTAVSQGYQVSRTSNPDGSARLVISVAA